MFMMPTGGKNCCVPSCTNCYSKTKGLGISYLSFPKKGLSEEQDIWRGRLVAAVSRGDKVFNPDTHHICSTHITKQCLVFHGKLFSSSHLKITLECNVD